MKDNYIKNFKPSDTKSGRGKGSHSKVKKNPDDTSLIPSVILDDAEKNMSKSSTQTVKRHKNLNLELQKMKLDCIDDFTS